MNCDGSIILEWSGQHRLFRLAWGDMFKLQDVTGYGPYHLCSRMMSSDWRVSDIWPVLLYALIGGGASAAEAVGLVKDAEKSPPAEALPVVRSIMLAATSAPEWDQIEFSGKSETKPDRFGRVKASTLYGNGAVMGLSPEQVDRSSIWQFAAAGAGYGRQTEKAGLSDRDADDLWAGVMDRMN